MYRGQNHKKTPENQRLTEVFCLMLMVPGTGLNSLMNNGFSWIWGIIFVPHKKFHFGVSRAQQGQSGKAGQIVGYGHFILLKFSVMPTVVNVIKH
jgi:hypothetical protein